MEEILIQSFIFAALISILLFKFIAKSLQKPLKTKNSPPSPPKLPIIGNLHQLRSSPHRDLRLLSNKHGPVMLLHFGAAPVLVISSADAAREIMKTNDLTFASRPLFKAHKKLSYNGKDVVFAPYGEYWRRAKSILVLRLLNSKRVESFRAIREEETALLMRRIGESSGPVNLSKIFSEFTNDGVCRSAFGRRYSETERGRRFLEVVRELSEVIGAVCVGEFVRWLRWIDRFSGFDEKVDRVARELDEFFESVIEGRIENYGESFEGKNSENFLDILLEIYRDGRDGVSIDRDGIKALILDVFGAGTDTTSIFLEWAMSELLRHPKLMEKLQNEVREIAQDNLNITEKDLENMHYLKAVIKETLRYHPPVPMLVPRIASKDVKIKGYDVSAGTLVMINAWAISRDPVSWDEPEKFKPERFLNSSMDYKGLNFEFLPFGAGRRVCPGMGFATATIELVLANLVQKFDWKLPQGDGIDMRESQGITVHRRVPLVALVVPRSK